MALYDYSQTPGSNTAISGINIAEGCNPSTINNAIRQLMADAREVYASATVASATPDIGAATATYVNITGTTTITGFGTVAAGTWRVCKFAGILTLTHNGTSLILPGAANITTAAGDALYAVSEGAGNWRVVAYQRASGAPVSLSTAQVATTYIADAAVTTDKIAAAAVTLAKVGLMSAGTVISFASGGTATAVETGVTGTVLMSNGATLLPSFQTVSQAIVLIASATADNSSPRIAITTGLDSTSYDEFLLTVEALLPATDDTTFSVQVSNDAGSAWATSSYLSACSWNVAGGAGGTASTTGVIMVRNAGTANVANDDTGWSGEVRIWPRGASKKKIITFHGGYATASAGIAAVTGSGIYNGDNAAVTGISIVTGSGNITSGTIRLYGVRNA